MNEEEIMNNEDKPIKLILKDGRTTYYGTYKILDEETVSFTDRRRVSFPISKSMFGVIEPVNKIFYQEGQR